MINCKQKQYFKSHLQGLLFIMLMCVCVLVCSLVQPETTFGRNIAFFPLLDLTKDHNGINMELSTRMHGELLEKGLELVSQEEIMAFLVRHRIRSLGMFNDYQNERIREELAADFILLGTVCQLGNGKNPSISINLQLSRTADKEIVWARNHALSFHDLITLLGMNDPVNLEDMLIPFFTELLADLPDEYEYGDKMLERLSISTVSIQPQYLRAGEEISCTIRTNAPLREDIPKPQLFIQAADRKLPLVSNEDGTSFQVSWRVEQTEGKYPVILVIQWADSLVQNRIVGTYSVDVNEPGTELYAIGRKYDNKILFSEKLVIVPKLVDPEPIDRWQVEVYDEYDESVVKMGETGKIPRNLMWQGKTSLGNIADPGEYRIVFRVWDRVERTSAAEIKVWFLPQPPEFLVDVIHDKEMITVGIENLTETPLSFWWAKFYREDGSLLKLEQGIDLPADIELQGDIPPEEKIECYLTARDILGNQSNQRIPNVLQLADLEASTDEQSTETDWVKEF